MSNAVAAPQAAADDDLKIVIIQGDGFVNNVRQRTARDPVVEVQDRNKKPIAGVLVTFRLPQTGPGGTFGNGLQTVTATTDQAGRATGLGFQPNQVAGKFNIDVQAEFQGKVARTSIKQRNVTHSRWLNWKTATVAAAIIIVVVIVIIKNRGSSTSVSLGQPTVGPR